MGDRFGGQRGVQGGEAVPLLHATVSHAVRCKRSHPPQCQHEEFAWPGSAPQICLRDSPRALVVMLKRYSLVNGASVKDASRVVVHDIFHIYDEGERTQARYKLMGWISHIGHSTSQGHYVAE